MILSFKTILFAIFNNFTKYKINEISGIENCNDLAMFIKEESKFRIIRIEIIQLII